jgi:regulator of sigma E protease
MEAFESLLAFILAVGVLITVHEFGHFWVARRLGVRILRFSVGFGRSLWSRRSGADGTEWVLAAIPLGGYVKMLDEREGDVAPHELDRAFNRQSPLARTAIVIAGPLANFIFAVTAYSLMYVIGVTGPRPILGAVAPGTPAAAAKLAAGDEIVAIAGHATATWENFLYESLRHVIEGEDLSLEVRGPEGRRRVVTVAVDSLSIDDAAHGGFLDKLGIAPHRPKFEARIGELVAGGAAERAGFRVGDRVVAADGSAIADWQAWVEHVQARPERRIETVVDRGGEQIAIVVTPMAVASGDRTVGRIGASVMVPEGADGDLIGVERYPPGAALVRAVISSWEMSLTTLRVLGKMVIGEASVANISGPISIAQIAGASAKRGAAPFLRFLAEVSISLFVLNLLPVPLLDGGHLMYYLIEFVTGKPLSEGAQLVGQKVGIAVLIALMGLALYNDLARVF